MKRLFICYCILVVSFFSTTVVANPEAFSFDQVINRARGISQKSYEEQNISLPDKLTAMNYDDFRNLRFVRENGPWYDKKVPFEVQFFHMGSIFKNSMTVNEIVEGQARKIPYSSKYFTLNDQPMEDMADIGYAGFRLHYPLNTKIYYDELITFLGASYFRALGVNQKYGLSARGLAIDTGLQSGEEFPVFKEFWIKRPVKRNRNIMVYALLDSPSVTGAYSFFIIPGATTRMEVTAVLFPRMTIKKVGVAPLTSMYLFGENTKNKFDDYRPEVHDSDGLLIWNNQNEWLWRPLDNSKMLRISSFEDSNVRGFGLMQRDREVRNYEDFEAHYQERPSVWVEPITPFGAGQVQLVEIPSDKEIHDNIVAFWVPKEPFEKGKEYRFNYRLNWSMNENPTGETVAEVISTHTGIGGVSGVGRPDLIKFVIDYSGETLNKIVTEKMLMPKVEASIGEVMNPVLVKNPITGGFRLFFDFKPIGNVSELRASLWLDDRVMTEIWSYQWLQ